MREDVSTIVISAEELRERISVLGEAITRDYAGSEPLLVGVLKGAVTFMVDLAREIDLPLEVDFMAVSSYGSSTRSTGVVRILKDLDQAIEGRHVLIVEDIVDSGLTLSYIVDHLRGRGPASVRICALLRKKRADASPPPIDYIGFDIPDEFVVGYGLDYAELYRNLPFIGVLRPEVYRDR